MKIAALLSTALLFGGMTLYSFGFAPMVFSALKADVAGGLLRKAFTHYYLFVFVTAAASAGALSVLDGFSAALMFGTCLVAVVARQVLMPAINTARDSGAKSRFDRLHGISVALNMVQLAAVVWVLIRLA
jgi:Domain of unknown function (DUF4149)